MCTTMLPTAAGARSRAPRNTQPTGEIAADKVELAFPYVVYRSSSLTSHFCGCCIAFLIWGGMCTTRLPTAAGARSRAPRNTQPTREIAADKVELAFPYLACSSSTFTSHDCGCCIAFLSWSICTTRLPTAAGAHSRAPRNTQPTREIAADKVELEFPYLVNSSSTLTSHFCSCCIALSELVLKALQGCPLQLEHIVVLPETRNRLVKLLQTRWSWHFHTQNIAAPPWHRISAAAA
jgi:hypothetical protein